MGRNLSNHSESPVGDPPRRRSPSRKSPSRIERSPTRHRRSHRGSSPPREKHSGHPKSPKHARSPSPPARSPSPRTKRLRRAQAGREAVKESERSNGRGTDRGLQNEGVSERDVGSDRKEKRSGRDNVDGKSSRPRHGTSPSDRQRRSRHISPSPQPAGVTRDVEKVIENDSERNHGRGSDRRMQREKGSDRETDSERVERRSGKDSTDHRSSRTKHGQSTSPLDRDHKNRKRSLSPQQAANTRARDEVSGDIHSFKCLIPLPNNFNSIIENYCFLNFIFFFIRCFLNFIDIIVDFQKFFCIGLFSNNFHFKISFFLFITS